LLVVSRKRTDDSRAQAGFCSGDLGARELVTHHADWIGRYRLPNMRTHASPVTGRLVFWWCCLECTVLAWSGSEAPFGLSAPACGALYLARWRLGDAKTAGQCSAKSRAIVRNVVLRRNLLVATLPGCF